MATDQDVTADPEKPEIADPRTESGKRRQILEGARAIFLAQGFDAASMGAIAKAAGVSKGTLYVYFKSKEELFGAIAEHECFDQGQPVFTFDSTAPIERELTRMGVEFARFLSTPAKVASVRTIIGIAERMPEIGMQFYRAGPLRGAASLQKYLEDKVAAGVLKPHDCEIAAAQLIDACVATISKPMLFNCAGAPTDAHISRVVEAAVGTFLAAYRA